MNEDIRTFGETLGYRALARDWPGVRALLAPWLQQRQTVADVQSFFEDEYRSVLSEYGHDGLHYPDYPEPDLDGNGFMTASALREPIGFRGGKVRDVAPEVTDANLRYWLRLQLQCSDEQMQALSFDYFCETWIAVVETSAGLRVGYWSQDPY